MPEESSSSRPTLLVAEPEPLQALSTRKLVLESGKFNVLTAHSSAEAVSLFREYPNVNAAILVGEGKIECDVVAAKIKSMNDKVPIIYLHANIAGHCPRADHQLSSHEPEALLELARSLFGDPRALG
jgi:hypothetical protein